jgi:hypothetical protein
MELTVRYLDGCPNWRIAEARLWTALERLGMTPSRVTRERVDTPEAADRLGFRGSPTILIDGDDPFADDAAPAGLSCRMYQTEAGPDGAPSAAQLAAALKR